MTDAVSPTGVGFLRSEPVDTQGPQNEKTAPSRNRREMRLERTNAITFKLTDGRQTKHWVGGQGAVRRHEHVGRAVAWLTNIGPDAWVILHKRKRSQPMKLAKAKRWVFEVVRGQRPMINVTDDPGWLSRTTAELMDQAVEDAHEAATPVTVGGDRGVTDLVGVDDELLREIVKTECGGA